MRTTLVFLAPAALAVALSAAVTARAETPADLLHRYEMEGSAGSSAERGAKFFKETHGQEWSCASCHTQNPATAGTHAKTRKPITPLAPAANAERFVRPEKVEKWFRRNCNDVLGRECTAREKGDVLAYLMSVRK